jgi:hypothetical protein
MLPPLLGAQPLLDMLKRQARVIAIVMLIQLR